MHVHECSACRSELAALGSTRDALARGRRRIPSWGSGSSAKKRPRHHAGRSGTFRRNGDWRRRPFCCSRSARQSRTSRSGYGSEGFVVRTGWGRSTAPAPVVANDVSAVPVAASSEEWKERLHLLDTRLQQLEQSNRRDYRGDIRAAEHGCPDVRCRDPARGAKNHRRERNAATTGAGAARDAGRQGCRCRARREIWRASSRGCGRFKVSPMRS